MVRAKLLDARATAWAAPRQNEGVRWLHEVPAPPESAGKKDKAGNNKSKKKKNGNKKTGNYNTATSKIAINKTKRE